MQLLLDHGSDPYIKNKYGDDAFQTASLEGNESMMVDLLNNFKPPVGKWIESYQLFGGYCVDYKNDIVKALDYWKKAVEMRKSDSWRHCQQYETKCGLSFCPGSENIGRVGNNLSEPGTGVHVYADDPRANSWS